MSTDTWVTIGAKLLPTGRALQTEEWKCKDPKEEDCLVHWINKEKNDPIKVPDGIQFTWNSLSSLFFKGTSYSPQENSHNHSALHSSNSHSSNPSNNPSKTSDAPYDSADDWSEHISSSGKKYYYNCRTEVSQWEKPKEWLEREQRQKEANKMAVNSFPKDRDYRREVMQATATSGFASEMEDKHSSDASSLLPQNILSQTSRHNDRDYRLPRADTHSSSAPVQHPIKPVVHPAAAPGALPSSPFTLQSDHQPKKSFDANGASTLSKLPTPTSSVPAQKTERKESAPGDKAVSHSCTTPSTSSASGLNPTSAPPTSASAVPVSPVPQSPIPPLLQDPNLLRQLLPALQATLQLNNSNVDISKINEVLTAAVTQASLRSIIHKFLTAFNITSLISQAAQLSTQGIRILRNVYNCLEFYQHFLKTSLKIGYLYFSWFW
nr:WW domain-containing adapter protein with coiled-coil-like [Oryctolagus cuniculus]